MKVKHIYISMALLALGLTACRRDELYDGPGEVRVRAYLQDAVTVTRSYTDVTAHPDYADRDFTAELFVSNGERVTRSNLRKQGNALTTTLRLETGEYWFHGYAPWRENAATCTTDASTSTMTITGIQGLAGQNLMLIKKETPLEVRDNTSHTVALKMDHLMAKVTPCFYIDSEYAKMRSIRIKKVEFMIDGAVTHTARVTYDNTSRTAASYTVAWEATATGNIAVTAYTDDSPSEDEALKTARAEALPCGACYLCPAQPVDSLQMSVTYDVYDTEGQLTRPDAKATNTILRLKNEELQAGTNYRLIIRIVPTYLYSLSDNDEGELLLVD